MKAGFLALALTACLGMGMGLRADIKFLWLDHPKGRNNPNDPGSPQYVSAAAASISRARAAGAPPLPAGTPRVVFDDFESDAWKPAQDYLYSLVQSPGAAATLSGGAGLLAPDGGTQSMQESLTFTAAGAGQLLWVRSEYGDGWGGPISVTGAARQGSLSLRMDVFSDIPVRLQWFLEDAQSPAHRSRYLGPPTPVAAGVWQTVSVPVALGAWDSDFPFLHLDELSAVGFSVSPAGAVPAASDRFGFDNIVFAPRPSPQAP
jgi:hypothetical protein